MGDNRNITVGMEYAATYPKNHRVLEQEMRKIVSQTKRKQNIARVMQYLDIQLRTAKKAIRVGGKPKARSSARIKAVAD